MREILNEASHSIILEHSFDALLLVEPAGRVRAANRECMEALLPGVDPRALAGKKLSTLRFPNLEKLFAAFVADEGDTRLDSALALTRGKDQRLFDIKMSKVRDDGGAVVLVTVFLREITFEVQREQRLWQSNEELSILYEISQVEVQSLDHDEILHNVLAKFSELTNLSKGFFLRAGARIAAAAAARALAGRAPETPGEFLAYNLSREEQGAVLGYLARHGLPPRLARREAVIVTLEKEKLPFLALARSLGYEKLVSIPVHLKETVFGTLVFLSSEADMLRLPANPRFFNLIGQQVGIALEKAKLFNELERSFREIEKKNRQLDDELALAQKMQRGILSLNFPKKPGIGFAVKYIPSYHLSGDFYDIFEISDDKIGVLIADVCGHGINSALVTSFLKASVRDMSQNYHRPDHLLDSLNQRLFELLNAEMFVSSFYLIIDLKARQLLYSNAGHPYPMLYRAASRDVLPLKVDGTLLSVMKDSQYTCNHLDFRAGDRVVLYTDGIFDMKNKRGEYLSMDFLEGFLSRHPKLAGDDFIESLIGKVFQYGDTSRFEDDINLIVVDFQ